MSVGEDTFIDDILKIIGFSNVLGHKKRYPEISPQDIKLLQPDFIFLSSEPYPFKEKHIKEIQEISPSSKIVLVDGEMFSWYGSRLLFANAYFHTLKRSLIDL
jgi:ABC-type Fe3+-hydroxamate transport system substrate-binding protein